MSRGDAIRSNCGLRSDRGQAPPLAVGSLARFSIGPWRLVPIDGDYSRQADRKRSISSVPRLRSATPPTARLLCPPRDPRETHAMAARDLPRSETPTSLCCLPASELSSILGLGGQPLWPRLAAASHSAGRWEDVPSASALICVVGVVPAIRPCSIAPLRHNAVRGFLIPLEKRSHLR